MAKKTKKKLNTSLGDDLIQGGAGYDDLLPKDDIAVDDLVPDIDPGDAIDPASDDITYTMGDIQVSDSDGDEDEDFKKASQQLTKDSDADGEEDDWIDEDAEFNVKDEDPFLDMDEAFDVDNPYSDDY
jgi:hypothetical protein